MRTYAQLVRLPNIFTALADICLAALAAQALPDYWLPLVFLLFSSACLYCGGMVWNDYFDLEQDRRERPFRPLPSGRVTPAQAARLGALLLAAGIGFAALADVRPEGFRASSVLLALGLVLAILLYDAWLKRTWAGPLGMGLCRVLNVLLGLSVVPGWVGGWGLYLALLVGLYIVGVTWFARTEASVSNQTALGLAAGVMLGALLLSLGLPVLAQQEASPPTSSVLFPYLLVAFGFIVGIPVCNAIAVPEPKRVQIAVKRCVLGLIALDAIFASALAGTVGLVLLLLLPPAMYLGKWIYST
jgi:4-hydroxybenzoate polyprenyltransferase